MLFDHIVSGGECIIFIVAQDWISLSVTPWSVEPWVSTVQGDCCHWFSQVLAINMTALPGVGLILKFSLISETD